jgi:hypothetical protein
LKQEHINQYQPSIAIPINNKTMMFTMSKIKITAYDQFLHEVQTWDRSLDFYKQENNFLKTRLSHVLDNNSDKTFLAFAEQFNSRFLFIDEYIKDLKRDLSQQVNMLNQFMKGNITQQRPLENLQKKLRTEMVNFEKIVTAIKYDFNQQLAVYLDIS